VSIIEANDRFLNLISTNLLKIRQTPSTREMAMNLIRSLNRTGKNFYPGRREKPRPLRAGADKAYRAAGGAIELTAELQRLRAGEAVGEEVLFPALAAIADKPKNKESQRGQARNQLNRFRPKRFHEFAAKKEVIPDLRQPSRASLKIVFLKEVKHGQGFPELVARALPYYLF